MKNAQQHLDEIEAKAKEFDDAEEQVTLYKETLKSAVKKRDAIGAELLEVIRDDGKDKLNFEQDEEE